MPDHQDSGREEREAKAAETKEKEGSGAVPTVSATIPALRGVNCNRVHQGSPSESPSRSDAVNALRLQASTAQQHGKPSATCICDTFAGQASAWFKVG